MDQTTPTDSEPSQLDEARGRQIATRRLSDAVLTLVHGWPATSSVTALAIAGARLCDTAGLPREILLDAIVSVPLPAERPLITKEILEGAHKDRGAFFRMGEESDKVEVHLKKIDGAPSPAATLESVVEHHDAGLITKKDARKVLGEGVPIEVVVKERAAKRRRSKKRRR